MTSAAGVESKQRKLVVFKEHCVQPGVEPSPGVLKPSLALTLSLDVLKALGISRDHAWSLLESIVPQERPLQGHLATGY